VLLIFVVATLLAALPMAAYAWTPDPPTDPLNACLGEPSGTGYEGLTRRIVHCVQNTILAAVYNLLGTLFSSFYRVLGAIMTLAVAFWGIMMAMGHRMALRIAPALAIKIAVLVILFTGSSFNFLYFYEGALDSLNEMLVAVTGYVAFSPSLDCGLVPVGDPSLVVWDRVDCALNTLIGGIYPDSSVALGVGGFLLAALLSGGPGIFIALLGILVVVQVLFAIIRALYVYILAYVAFALMALVAPIFLPMILFKTTQGYFEKWLKLTIGFILQPIFIFVFLTMLLAAYDTVVYTGRHSLYNVITNDEYLGGCAPPTGGTCADEGCTITDCQPIGNWLAGATSGSGDHVYTKEERGNISVNTNPTYSGSERCEEVCNPNTGRDETGMENTLAEIQTRDTDWPAAVTNSVQKYVYNALHIDDYFFHVNMPMDSVNWQALAAINGTTDDDGDGSIVDEYFIEIIMALFMAVATTFIFLLLLERLPFIGSGIMNIGSFISAGSGMPGFGFGSLSPPGASMIDRLQKKITGR